MIGVYHLKSLLTAEALEQIQSYYSSFSLNDITVRNKQEHLYHTWYKHGDKDDPFVAHLRVHPHELNIANDIIVKAACDLFRRPFNHDGSLNIIHYDVGGQSPVHKDANGRFTGKEYTFITIVDDGFEGGEFFINDEVIHLERGDALIFQINYPHGIKPVTKGNRVSLVARLFEE